MAGMLGLGVTPLLAKWLHGLGGGLASERFIARAITRKVTG